MKIYCFPYFRKICTCNEFSFFVLLVRMHLRQTHHEEAFSNLSKNGSNARLSKNHASEYNTLIPYHITDVLLRKMNLIACIPNEDQLFGIAVAMDVCNSYSPIKTITVTLNVSKGHFQSFYIILWIGKFCCRLF